MDKIRQQKLGIAISKAGHQTIIVRVDTHIAHPLYKKRVRKTKRFAVHDVDNKVQVGDTVLIGETRPISKTKHWEVIEITKSNPVTPIGETV